MCFFAAFAISIQTAGDEWKPIEPAHLALKSSTIEKEADAEGLFWEVRIDDNPRATSSSTITFASRSSRCEAGSHRAIAKFVACDPDHAPTSESEMGITGEHVRVVREVL